MPRATNPPLADFSTQAARTEERHRRKQRRKLRADWQRTRQALGDDAEAAIRGISDAEWQAAQEEIE